MENLNSLKLLEKHLENWDVINKKDHINDTEVEGLVNNIEITAHSVFENYSRLGKLNEISDVLNLLRKDIKEIEDVLKSSLDNRIQSQGRITFKKHQTDQKELTKHLLYSLTHLNSEMDDILTYGMLINHFTAHFPKAGHISLFFSSLVKGLFGKIQQAVREKLFYGYNSNLKREKLLKIIPKLIEKKNKLEDKDLDKITELKGKIEKIEDKLKDEDIAPKEKEPLEQNLLELKAQSMALKGYQIIEELNQAQKHLDEIEDKLKKGQVTRANFHMIGGEAVKLKVPHENVTLDGMYLSGDAFRKSLKQAHAQAYELSLKAADGDQEFNLKGIMIEKGHDEDHEVLAALENLRAFSNEKEGAGWRIINFKDHILFVEDEEATRLEKAGVLVDSQIDLTQCASPPDFSQKELDLEQSSGGGTVLLTYGNAGVYEMYKREMLAFLMKGMNVMAINFRGYGASTGIPSGEGLKRDMEAAYQYLHEVHHVSDQQLMLKALCMSGGPATYLASRHPDINLFLDQSYADFSEIIEDIINSQIQEYTTTEPEENPKTKRFVSWVHKNMSFITKALSRLIAPAWIIEKEIGKVKGKVGILLSTDDDLMLLDRDVKRNYEAVLKRGRAGQVSIFSIKGEHANLWLDAKDTRFPIEYATSEQVNEIAKEFRKENPKFAKYDYFASLSKKEVRAMGKQIKAIAKDEGIKYPKELNAKKLIKFINRIDSQIRPSLKKAKIKKIFQKEVKELKLNDEMNKIVIDCLRSTLKKQEILASLHYSIKYTINEKTLTPAEAQELIKSKVDEYFSSESLRQEAMKFFDQTIKMRAESLADEKLSQELFTGRIQMDLFLDKAGLRGHLTPEVEEAKEEDMHTLFLSAGEREKLAS